MHPAVVLPAIETSRISVQEQIASRAKMEAKLKQGEMILSFNPHVQSPGGAEIPESSDSFKFWAISDEETFSTFMEGFGIELDMLDHSVSVDFDQLPPGYGVARYVLRFETHLKFSSWLAMQNVGPDDMRKSRSYYRKVGLNAEADALEKAEAAWYAAGGHEGGGYDAASEAYRSVENPYRDEDERWFHILGVLRAERWWVGMAKTGSESK